MKSKKSLFVLLLSIVLLTMAAYSNLNALYKKQVNNQYRYGQGVAERQMRSIKLVPAAVIFLLHEYR